MPEKEHRNLLPVKKIKEVRKMEKKIRVKECAMCGKVFAVSGRGNRCYCGARCRREKILQASREYYRAAVQRRAEETYAGPASGPVLAEMNRRARAAGMSYGKYMLSLRMERQKGERAEGGGNCAGEMEDAPPRQEPRGA